MSNKGTNTKGLLIEKATPLFAKKGYDGTTIKDICDATGMNVSLVSYYFGGKEGLFHSCIESFGEFGLKTAEKILVPPKSREEFDIRLTMFLDEMINVHFEHMDLMMLIHREMENQSQKSSEIFKQTFHKVFELLVGFFETAKGHGIISKDLDPRLCTSILFGSIKSFFMVNARVRKLFSLPEIDSPAARKKVRDHYLKIFCEGFCDEKNNN